jgi:hypothetical protein
LPFARIPAKAGSASPQPKAGDPVTLLYFASRVRMKQKTKALDYCFSQE